MLKSHDRDRIGSTAKVASQVAVFQRSENRCSVRHSVWRLLVVDSWRVLHYNLVVICRQLVWNREVVLPLLLMPDLLDCVLVFQPIL